MIIFMNNFEYNTLHPERATPFDYWKWERSNSTSAIYHKRKLYELFEKEKNC